MQCVVHAFVFGPLLKSVSRSFYLTLRILPTKMRDPISLAYLLARAADTIADTSLILPEQRLTLLLELRAYLNNTSKDREVFKKLTCKLLPQKSQLDEKILLESVGLLLAMLLQLSDVDRVAVCDIVTTIIQGIEFDLRTFVDVHSGHIVALCRLEELEHYTYLVAGCVGKFWTQMAYAYMPSYMRKGDYTTMLQRGVRFGKALQMMHLLRDCGQDLRIGRCYLPTSILRRYGLSPQDLLMSNASLRTRPLMFELVRKTLDQFRDAIEYTFAISPFQIRLRLACLWPILIGLETLLLIVTSDAWLDPAKISKIQRCRVYKIVAISTLVAPANALLGTWTTRLIRNIEAQLKTHNRA